MDMQPTTYRPLVSDKFNITDQKMKKLYKENKHLSKIFPMKLTRFLQFYSFGNGSSSKLLLQLQLQLQLQLKIFATFY